MLGQMQDQPLLISSLIDFAGRHHHEAEIVSRRVEGDLHRYTYADAAKRSRRVANALDQLRNMARSVSQSYLDSRIQAGFPMCKQDALTRLGIDLPALQAALLHLLHLLQVARSAPALQL